ncbi:type II toxin-antitoxin system Phd/YefM family antitoxin [Paenarthrobacter sp. NPDC057981]|uniref:type II toxin-antitoxin system Phd/YefM family antitoxin n=1 Tax=Paenarthrobacter sp. NPDC057981 TaxID=3346297 RepID=UPI0036D7AE4B
MGTADYVVSVADLRVHLSDTINRAAYGHERISITRRGKVAAVLISAEDLERLERLEDEADLRALHAAKAEDDGARVSLDDLLEENGIAR